MPRKEVSLVHLRTHRFEGVPYAVLTFRVGKHKPHTRDLFHPADDRRDYFPERADYLVLPMPEEATQQRRIR